MSVQQRSKLWQQVSSEKLPTTGWQLPPPVQMALQPFWRPPRPVPGLLPNETPRRLAAVGTPASPLAKVRSELAVMPLAAEPLALAPLLYRQRIPALSLTTTELLALQLAESHFLPEPQAPAEKQSMSVQQR